MPEESISMCDICYGDGQIESTRDYGWDKDGMMKCYKCNGVGEIKSIDHDFCSEDCFNEQ